MNMDNETRLYVPVGPVGLLDEVRDWLVGMNVTGWTEYQASGVWHDGQGLVKEPVVVIECWTEKGQIDVVEFMAILALYGEKAGFAVQDGQAKLVELARNCDECQESQCNQSWARCYGVFQ